MNTYQKNKARARHTAQAWQAHVIENQDISYLEMAEAQAYFIKLGRKYGLIREFRENAII